MVRILCESKDFFYNVVARRQGTKEKTVQYLTKFLNELVSVFTLLVS